MEKQSAGREKTDVCCPFLTICENNSSAFFLFHCDFAFKLKDLTFAPGIRNGNQFPVCVRLENELFTCPKRGQSQS